jgi:hypothetical protein
LAAPTYGREKYKCLINGITLPGIKDNSKYNPPLNAWWSSKRWNASINGITLNIL